MQGYLTAGRQSVSLRPRTPALVVIAMVWLVVADIPTNITFGPLSLSGLATLGVAAVLVVQALGMLASRRRTGVSLRPSKVYEPYLDDGPVPSILPLPLVLFVVAAAFLLALNPTPDGLQNAAVYAIFVLSIPAAAAASSLGTSDWALGWYRRFAVAIGLIVLGQSLAGIEIYGPRPVALVLVVLLAVVLALPRTTWFDKLLPLLVFAACALTLSRTALFVSAILLPISLVFTARRNGLIKVILAAVPIYYVMYLLVTSWPPLRDRFIKGDAAYSFGGLDLNTSGRSVLWEMTLDSWQKAPLFGNGPGSASALISARFDNIGHPHNDYLRILHDFGLIGFVPFLIGLVLILRSTMRRARSLPEPIHKAAALALLGVIGVAVTDNVLVYPFVMLPVGTLVGMSLAYPIAPRRKVRSASIGSGARGR